MKYSFILEIDEISKDDINELISVLSDNKIKFHVLKSDKELKENQKLKEQLKIKHDGFMASVDESCEYAEENQKYKEVIDKSIKCIDYNNRYRNGADIYQFVDIKGEILEPLKDILEQNEENSNIYLKEFNDWLKEVEHE